MTETEYAVFLANQGAIARDYVTRLMYAWRLELWPRIYDDPIHWEDVERTQWILSRLHDHVSMPVLTRLDARKIVGIA